MKNLKYKFSLTALLFLSLLFACKQDAPENPCKNQEEVRAEIKLEEQVGELWFEGDSVNSLNFTRFTSVQDADEYTWYLGSEVIKTKSFKRWALPDGWINVSLAVRKIPNKLCYPNDDGYDSTSKLFYFWPEYRDINDGPPLAPYYPVYGTYKGYRLSNPNHEVIVSVKDTFWTNKNNKPMYVYMLSGIPYDNRGTTDSGQRESTPFIGFSPKVIYFKLGGLPIQLSNGQVIEWIPYIEGYAILDRLNSNKIRIEYKYSDTISWKVPLPFEDVFVGTRIY